AGIQVPEELAVLGVGNDDLETSFSQPQLSSIEPDAQGAGRAAAALLDARMNDPDGPVINVLLPPVRLIRRQSTDVLALDDSRLCAAIRMVREGACSGLRVEDVVKAVCLSRRQLEARFRRHLGRSPHQEILRTRLQRAKELLEETQLTLADVAERCGFEHVEYFHVVFKRHEKVTPGAWRLAHRSRKNR
ncbi:MAG: helix-turn-helix domain-containing protein, partial [Akkermansiaceae bacterium]|nr:helix-turn-helix domain-containing protein [Verrucomicrobiales bacterium]